jgi:hypothetical protein
MRLDSCIAMFFASAEEQRARWFPRLWVVGMFVTGLVGWSYVFGWGRTPLDFHDWPNINLPRLMFLQNALRGGDWPLHMAGTASLHGVTDRFLALPDVVTSPQTLLLLIVPVNTFVLIDVLIEFTIGFAGLLLLRRYLEWSLFTLTAVSMLFLFNGHILSHYSVGHFTWGAYFLFPLVVLLILRFLDGDTSMRSLASFAAVMFYMVLTGGQHHMTWVLLLLILLVPFCWDRAWWLAGVALASGMLSAVRLLPPALELQSFRSAGLVADVIGFPSFSHVVTALAVLRRETPSFNEALPGNIWFFDSAFYEFNAYVGVAGLAGIVAGSYFWLRDEMPRYRQLIVPVFAMAALSIGTTYRLIRATAIPLLEGERYTGRMLSLPLTVMIILAAIAIDRRLRGAAISVWHRIVAGFALLFIAIDVAGSARLWRLAVSSGLFGQTSFSAADAAVVHRSDPAYLNVVLAGLALTIATAVGLIALVYRERAAARAQIS